VVAGLAEAAPLAMVVPYQALVILQVVVSLLAYQMEVVEFQVEGGQALAQA